MGVHKHVVQFSQRGAKNVTSAMGSIKGAVKGLVASYAVLKTGQKALEWSKMAGQMQGVERAFANLSKEPNKLMKSMRKATGGMISDLELMQKANQSALLGLPTERFDDMLKIARSSSQATGESMDFMLNSIVTGLGRGSKLMLDNLGILIDTETANENYAKSIGKVAKELTEEERKQAFINEALKVGLDNVEKSGGVIEQQGDAFARFGASLKNFGTEVGESILPTVSEITNRLADAFDFAGKVDWSKTMENLKNNMYVLGNAIIESFKTTLGIIPEIFSFAWKKAVEHVPPIFTKLLEWIKDFATYVFEPIVIASEIAWTVMKRTFAIMWNTMKNLAMVGIKPIVEIFNSLANSWLGAKMKLQPIKLPDMVDSKDIKNGYDELINKLKTRAMETNLMKDMFGSGSPTTMEEFGNDMIAIWDNALGQLVIMSKETGDIVKTNLNPGKLTGTGSDNESGEGGIQGFTESWSTALEETQLKVSDYVDATSDLFNNLYDYKKQARDQDMNNEIKTVELSGLNEEAKNAKINNIKEKYRQKDLEAKKKLKPIKLAEAISNTALGVATALKSTPNAVANLALASIVGASGAVQIATIAGSEYHSGGLINGGDNVPITAQGGEFVMQRSAVDAIGTDTLNNMNQGGESIQNVNISIEAPVLDDVIIDEIMPKISRAVKEGRAQLTT